MALSWKSVVPEIPVRKLDRALGFYQDILGFTVDWVYEERFASVSSGNARLFLEKRWGDEGVQCDLYVEDADAAYAELRSRNAPLVGKPEDKPWGTREFGIEDPDGNSLRVHSLLRARA
jgi:uncharacterized glyoxalase superfamily protein PhnB